jgi:late competence protein required for DNA uptake (superfamily II DNA/RNA helicase)
MAGNDKVKMNKELKKWIQESKKEIDYKIIIKKDSKEPEGKCQICGEKKAIAVCLKCSRSICKSCYFKIVGICKKCVPTEIASKWDGSQPDWEKQLGVEWIG